MELWLAKTLSMSLLALVSLSCGLTPLFLKRCLSKKSKMTELSISALSCFGGGVVLTTCLTHMLPEVNQMLDKNVAKGEIPKTGMPLAEIFVLCGFFMIYIVEEFTHALLNSCHPDKKNANKNDKNAAAIRQHDDRGCDDMMHHVEIEGHNFEATLRGFLVILALSLHAVFEGIALGLTSSVTSVWFIFFAIASHKFVISFCVGMQLVTSGVKILVSVLYIATFAFISPLGAAIGLVMSSTGQMGDVDDPAAAEASLQGAVVTVLQGLATGTLLYVVFFEVIEKERQKGTNGMLQAIFIVLGFLCMVCLEYVEVSGSGKNKGGGGGGGGGETQSWVCQLQEFQPGWSPPLNLTCVGGILRHLEP